MELFLSEREEDKQIFKVQKRENSGGSLAEFSTEFSRLLSEGKDDGRKKKKRQSIFQVDTGDWRELVIPALYRGSVTPGQKKDPKNKGSQSQRITPGGEDTPYEDLEAFQHQYYDVSIQIIDLIILGKEAKIQEKNLLIEIVMQNVFFEEPLDSDEHFFLLSDSSSNRQSPLNGDIKFDRGKSESHEWKMQMEKRKYIEVKSKGNNTEQLYLIDARWVRRWINFIRFSSACSPGPIINDSIYQRVEDHETLILGEDMFVISQGLWAIFYSWYGGGPTLKWKIQQDKGEQNAQQQPPLLIEKKDVKFFEKPVTQVQPPTQVQKKIKAYDASDFIKRSDSKEANLHKPELNNMLFGNTPKPPPMLREISESSQSQYQIEAHNKSKGILFRPKLFGLENNRYFCYLNAVLQCLFSISEFVTYYEEGLFMDVQMKNPVQKGLSYSRMISKFAEEINTKNMTLQKPTQVRVLRTTAIQKLIQKEFNPARQNDSHEFLLYFFNNLKDETTEKGSKLPTEVTGGLTQLWASFSRMFPSEIDRLFTVIEKSTIQCSACMKSISSIQYYLCFPLQVQNIKTIHQSLKQHIKKERLPDYKCESCGIKQFCSITRMLMRLPEVFVFQMQRFAMEGKLKKIRGLIDFGDFIDMSPYIDPQYQREDCNQKALYELVAVAVHLGTIYGGHYVAYCKKEDGCWYFMDDQRVGKVSQEEVFQQDAYLLFYSRVHNEQL